MNLCNIFNFPAIGLMLTPLLTVSPCSAQNTATVGVIGGVAAGTPLLTALRNASTFFAANDATDGLAAIAASNLQTPGTAEWSMATGFSLLQLAAHFHSKGDSATSAQIITLVEQQLVTAESQFTSATPVAEQANEQELRGVIAEHYLGDRNAAKTYYSKAVALAPTLGQAPALLAALLRSQAEEAKKLKQ